MKRMAGLWIAAFGAVLVLASAPVRAQICVTSDDNLNTGCGTDTLTVNSGSSNTAIGYRALYQNTTGVGNTASGNLSLYFNSSGGENTATGFAALLSNTTGGENTANGVNALAENTTGYANTATGAQALLFNNTGIANTADGYAALNVNTTGSYNTADGLGALGDNKVGSENTASGFEALQNNITGNNNTASGYSALSSSTTAGNNTAAGYEALTSDTTGGNNTASGSNSLVDNTTGFDNTASGYQALHNTTTGHDNVAMGYDAGYNNTVGAADTFVGTLARPNTGRWVNGTALGFEAILTASNSVVLGNSKIAAIYAQVTSITALSDRRRKKDIAPLPADLGLAFVATLKPVSYRFKNGDETLRYGFIAQDLEAALPSSLRNKVENAKPGHGLALIARDNDKDRTYRVAYGELTAPMVRAIQEQQQEIAALRSENTELRLALANQSAQDNAMRRAIAALQQQVGAMELAQSSEAGH